MAGMTIVEIREPHESEGLPYRRVVTDDRDVVNRLVATANAKGLTATVGRADSYDQTLEWLEQL